MKKFLSLLLIFSILLASVPAGALAASSDYLIVTRDNAPIRTGPSEDDSIVARCSKGDLLETTGSTLNWRLNHWYKVRYNGSTRYIYSGMSRNTSTIMPSIPMKACVMQSAATADTQRSP